MKWHHFNFKGNKYTNKWICTHLHSLKETNEIRFLLVFFCTSTHIFFFGCFMWNDCGAVKCVSAMRTWAYILCHFSVFILLLSQLNDKKLSLCSVYYQKHRTKTKKTCETVWPSGPYAFMIERIAGIIWSDTQSKVLVSHKFSRRCKCVVCVCTVL